MQSYKLRVYFFIITIYKYLLTKYLKVFCLSQDERDKWIQNELRQLTKQIKDKEEHQKKISEDLKRDAEKQVNLEKKIGDHTREMERQRISIDDHNKQYYDLTKSKDQCQANRKEQ